MKNDIRKVALSLFSFAASIVIFAVYTADPSEASSGVSLAVSESVDDIRRVANSNIGATNAPTHHLGKFGSVDYWSGWRWQNVNIPNNALIKSATLDLYSAGVPKGTEAKVIFHGSNVDNMLPKNSIYKILDAHPRTAAFTKKTFDVKTWRDAEGFGVDRIDVTTIIQEIISREGWQSGNSLFITAHDDGSLANNYVAFSTYDRAPDRGARLSVEFETTEAVYSPTPTPPAATPMPDGDGLNTWKSFVMAWIFPGKPACNTSAEYQDGRSIHMLKPEYFTVNSDGVLVQKTEQSDGCNGYSPTNAASIKEYSKNQFVTVSGTTQTLFALTNDLNKQQEAVNTLVNFVIANDFTGVEIDFEQFGGWNEIVYERYKALLLELGNGLHAHNKKLMVDAPPISNDLEQSYYKFKYEDFNALPIDYLVIMAYDYQYDHGIGEPVAPNDWVIGIIKWAKDRLQDHEKIVIGIPAYGYFGWTGGYQVIRINKEQAKQLQGYETAVRDPRSYEMKWERNGITYVYQDSESLNKKRTLIEALGIKYVSVWHLGGNDWFTGKLEK